MKDGIRSVTYILRVAEVRRVADVKNNSSVVILYQTSEILLLS
jgi:hypothetical protein